MTTAVWIGPGLVLARLLSEPSDRPEDPAGPETARLQSGHKRDTFNTFNDSAVDLSEGIYKLGLNYAWRLLKLTF